MKKIIHTTAISFTIWVTASLLNGLLFIAVNILLNPGSAILPRFGAIAFACAFCFSVPGIIIFWLLFFAYYHKQDLFQILLRVAFITSLLSGIIFYNLVTPVFTWRTGVLLLNTVIAAIASLLFHHTLIAKIIKPNQYV